MEYVLSHHTEHLTFPLMIIISKLRGFSRQHSVLGSSENSCFVIFHEIQTCISYLNFLIISLNLSREKERIWCWAGEHFQADRLQPRPPRPRDCPVSCFKPSPTLFSSHLPRSRVNNRRYEFGDEEGAHEWVRDII